MDTSFWGRVKETIHGFRTPPTLSQTQMWKQAEFEVAELTGHKSVEAFNRAVRTMELSAKTAAKAEAWKEAIPKIALEKQKHYNAMTNSLAMPGKTLAQTLTHQRRQIQLYWWARSAGFNDFWHMARVIANSGYKGPFVDALMKKMGGKMTGIGLPMPLTGTAWSLAAVNSGGFTFYTAAAIYSIPLGILGVMALAIYSIATGNDKKVWGDQSVQPNHFDKRGW